MDSEMEIEYLTADGTGHILARLNFT